MYVVPWVGEDGGVGACRVGRAFYMVLLPTHAVGLPVLLNKITLLTYLFFVDVTSLHTLSYIFQRIFSKR